MHLFAYLQQRCATRTLHVVHQYPSLVLHGTPAYYVNYDVKISLKSIKNGRKLTIQASVMSIK